MYISYMNIYNVYIIYEYILCMYIYIYGPGFRSTRRVFFGGRWVGGNWGGERGIETLNLSTDSVKNIFSLPSNRITNSC